MKEKWGTRKKIIEKIKVKLQDKYADDYFILDGGLLTLCLDLLDNIWDITYLKSILRDLVKKGY